MQTGEKSTNSPRCLICDADIAEDDDGYNILCNGSSLYQLVNNILRLDLDAIVARSTLLCKNCFELLAELEAAENRCVEIRNSFRLSFAKTCQLNGDEYAPFVVAGIACQTDSEENPSTNRNGEKQDLKMKITLVSKRKRGRPSKSATRSNKRCESPSLDDPLPDDDKPSQTVENGSAAVAKSSRRGKERSSKRDKTEEIARLETLILEARRTRSTARAGNARKKTLESEPIKEEPPEQPPPPPPVETVEANGNSVIDEAKIENVPLNADEIFVEEFNVNDTTVDNDDDGDDDDDDDFEWKEESAADSQDNSEKSADESKGRENDKNDEDSRSVDSRDGGKKKGRKKKRKRGDRKGERAFMVPIHECQQCGKKWRTVTELKSHVASHSALRPFVCEICGQAYKMKKALDIHIGMHNGIHPFVCSYCNKSFTQKVGLEKHLPIHTGVTRFQCDLCGKRFIHQKSFNIHKMTHTGEKNIHCPICKLAVFSQSHLKRHYRVHTGERPYGCTICGKKFAEKYNLNAHTKIHDPNSAGEGRRRCHTCPICGITYDRKHKMADHLSTAHCMWQQSSTIEFKQEDFYNVDLQQPQTQQHHMLPLQAQQHSSAIQPTQSQQPQPAQLSQQQTFAPAPQPQQQQTQQQSVTAQSSQPTQQQQQQQPTQMVAHPTQHHLHTVAAHHQQQQSTQLSSHSLQTHHAQATGTAPHHLLVTQHQLQQSLQTHPVHHSLTPPPPPPPPLQPISSVFQVVLQPPPTLDTASSTAVHHNHNRSHMNAVPTLMPVPTP